MDPGSKFTHRSNGMNSVGGREPGEEVEAAIRPPGKARDILAFGVQMEGENMPWVDTCSPAGWILGIASSLMLA